METIIIDGEEEAMPSRKPLIVTVVAIILALAGVVFGLVQKSEKDSLNTRISNLEQGVNLHVAEVEALKKQLIENNIKPNIVTSTETKTATNSETTTSDKEDSSKKTDEIKKETAGEGYTDVALELKDDWAVKFYLPTGIKYLNYVYPSENSISITGITTENKTYGSETCASGFGQLILGGSTGEKLYSDQKGTYYYNTPSGNCSGSDFEAAVSLTKKLFKSIAAK